MAVNQENQQSLLKIALPLVRFPLMSVVEFSSKVTQSGLLTKEELVSLYLYLTTKPRPATDFNDLPRLSDRELIVNRFKSSQRRCESDGLLNQIDFASDHGLQLLGFGLYGSTSGPAKYDLRLSLKQGPLIQSTVSETAAIYVIDSASMTFKVLFKQPVKISAHVRYTVELIMKGPDCFTGKGGLEEVTVDSLHGQKIKIKFFSTNPKFPNLRTDVIRGQIPQIIFKV